MHFDRVALALFAFAGLATPVEGRDDPVAIKVKPVLCITDERTPQCEMSFIVDWTSARAGDYCLYNDFSVEPLDCWEQQAAGRLVEDRVVEETFSYWLTRADVDGRRLAEAMVEVMSTDSPDRRRHRKSRHVWSIL